MKINYIHEGYFKNPEQMKHSAEERNKLSASQRISSAASELVIKRTESFLNEKFLTITTKTHSYFLEWVTNIVCDVSGISLYNFNHFSSTRVPMSVNLKIREQDNKLLIDVYPKILIKLNDDFKQETRDEKNVYILDSTLLEYFASYNDCRRREFKNKPISDSGLGAAYLLNDLQALHLKDNFNDLEEKNIYDYLLHNNLAINKIHLFGDIDSDIEMRFKGIVSSFGPSKFTIGPKEIEYRTELLNDIISFDNKGKCIYNVLDTSDRRKSKISKTLELYDFWKELGTPRGMPSMWFFDLLFQIVKRAITPQKLSAYKKKMAAAGHHMEDDIAKDRIAREYLVDKMGFSSFNTPASPFEVTILAQNCIFCGEFDKETGKIVLLPRIPIITYFSINKPGKKTPSIQVYHEQLTIWQFQLNGFSGGYMGNPFVAIGNDKLFNKDLYRRVQDIDEGLKRIMTINPK